MHPSRSSLFCWCGGWCIWFCLRLWFRSLRVQTAINVLRIITSICFSIVPQFCRTIPSDCYISNTCYETITPCWIGVISHLLSNTKIMHPSRSSLFCWCGGWCIWFCLRLWFRSLRVQTAINVLRIITSICFSIVPQSCRTIPSDCYISDTCYEAITPCWIGVISHLFSNTKAMHPSKSCLFYYVSNWCIWLLRGFINGFTIDVLWIITPICGKLVP